MESETVRVGRGESKTKTQVRRVSIEKGRVVLTIHLAKKDALRLAKQIQAKWPTKSKP